MQNERIVLGVTGGIAAYKAAALARLFVKGGAEVRVVMTAHAREFVTPLTFEALTGNPVAAEMFAPRTDSAHAHVELARWAKVLVVAPATANVIGKLALGLADDLLSTTALAFSGDGDAPPFAKATDGSPPKLQRRGAPLVVAPAMNTSMWRHPAVRANVSTLRERGAVIVGPGEGDLSCGEAGPGRMAEPAEILEAVRALLAPTNGE